MQETVKYIKQTLVGSYPQTEINSFSRLIMEHVTGMSLALIMSDRSRKIGKEQRLLVETIVNRLRKQEPIQYILGETEFYGLPFGVNPAVLIPRPETEELVELISNANKNNKIDILDIGTGSGCIAIALAHLLPEANVWAWDISTEALLVARNNATRNRVKVQFDRVDVLSDYPKDKTYDVIVSNPPYVLESEKDAMEANVLDNEPHLALFVPDKQALLFYERIADLAKHLLNWRGKLYFEINATKGSEIMDLLHQEGYTNISLHQDLSKKARMIVAEYHLRK